MKKLTRRQREVVLLLMTGRTQEGVARSLGVTPYTVKHHVNVALRKYGANSALQLAVLLVKHGLITVEEIPEPL